MQSFLLGVGALYLFHKVEQGKRTSAAITKNKMQDDQFQSDNRTSANIVPDAYQRYDEELTFGLYNDYTYKQLKDMGQILGDPSYFEGSVFNEEDEYFNLEGVTHPYMRTMERFF